MKIINFFPKLFNNTAFEIVSKRENPLSERHVTQHRSINLISGFLVSNGNCHYDLTNTYKNVLNLTILFHGTAFSFKKRQAISKKNANLFTHINANEHPGDLPTMQSVCHVTRYA